MMVVPIIGAAARIGSKIAMKTLAAEGAALGKAWWGFKSRREIVAGIRTGLGLGAGIGSFINDGSNPFMENETSTGFKPTTSKFKKGNYRFNSSSRRGRSYKYCRPCKRRR